MPMQTQSASRLDCRILRRWKIAAGITVALFLALNGLAYFHARAMTSFSIAQKRSGRPEELSALEKVGVLLTGVKLPRPANDRTPDEIGLEFETVEICGDDGT